MMQEGKSYSRPLILGPYNCGMDEVRKLVEEFARRPGQSLKKLSEAIGQNETYLQQFLKRGSPRRLPEVQRAKLALIMGVDETLLGKPLVSAPPRTQQNARVVGPVALGGVIPVYGQAMGGREGQFILNGNRMADILAPPSLAGVRDAYAVMVTGESMEPRYHPGETVYVNPRLPIRRGDYVVAQIIGADHDQPEAYVKQFIGQDAHVLRLGQLNPRKTLEFPRRKAVSIHKIIMGGEG